MFNIDLVNLILIFLIFEFLHTILQIGQILKKFSGWEALHSQWRYCHYRYRLSELKVVLEHCISHPICSFRSIQIESVASVPTKGGTNNTKGAAIKSNWCYRQLWPICGLPASLPDRISLWFWPRAWKRVYHGSGILDTGIMMGVKLWMICFST